MLTPFPPRLLAQPPQDPAQRRLAPRLEEFAGDSPGPWPRRRWRRAAPECAGGNPALAKGTAREPALLLRFFLPILIPGVADVWRSAASPAVLLGLQAQHPTPRG